MPKLNVYLCDIFTCSKKNCFSYDVKKFVKAYCLSNKPKILNKNGTQNLSKKKNLEVHLCDIFTCSKKNCISYDVKKFVKSYLNKQRILNKNCTQNVSEKKYLEVHLCDIFTCSENCFSHDITEHVKTSQKQLKSLNKKFHLSNFIKRPKSCNENTEKEHSTSFRTKRVNYLKTLSESESGYSIQAHSESESSYSIKEAISNEEKEESESDYESITETETETETESSTDTDSDFYAIRNGDYEYVPWYKKERKNENTNSESDSGTENESNSKSYSGTEDESNSKSDSGTEDESNSESGRRIEAYYRSIKQRTSERVLQKKKLMKWRLRRLMEN